MKEKNKPQESAGGNVLPISMDAGFFFERAVSSLDRYHYDKALKYFRKAVEYEPDNPVNHCNMAGILSEMGDYKASNAALLVVLNEIDPSMTECYFYMANNYANMDMFEEAEEALVTYLEEDPNGQFLGEAQEMMDLLQYELDRPTKLKSIKSREGIVEHDQARKLLEEGEFVQAVKLLEEVVENHPDFLAARNNLALGYYYLGRFAKSKEAIYRVLEQEPGNLHALCNLAIFHQYEGEEELLKELASRLSNVVPFHQEHVFKLATTMGILGQHKSAYIHFRRLLQDGEVNHDPCLHHYAAVAAYSLGRYTEAKKLWNNVKKMDPESDISVFYLSRVDSVLRGEPALPISYNYKLPYEEQFKLWEESKSGIINDISNDPLLRSSLLWALNNGDHDSKLKAIQILGQIADTEVIESFKSFLLDSDQDEDLKEVARDVLEYLGAHTSLESKVENVHYGSDTMTAMLNQHSQLPVWEKEWQSVIDLALQHLKKSFTAGQQRDLQTLWIDFLSRLYPDTPVIRHNEGWAAALEYLTCKIHGNSVTYDEVASKYGISSSTVSRYVAKVNEVCGVKEKIKTIFPSVQ